MLKFKGINDIAEIIRTNQEDEVNTAIVLPEILAEDLFCELVTEAAYCLDVIDFEYANSVDYLLYMDYAGCISLTPAYDKDNRCFKPVDTDYAYVYCEVPEGVYDVIRADSKVETFMVL